MAGYWAAEFYDEDDGEVTACWTTERPGKTGPYGLERQLAELVWQGWTIRWVEAA